MKYLLAFDSDYHLLYHLLFLITSLIKKAGTCPASRIVYLVYYFNTVTIPFLYNGAPL